MSTVKEMCDLIYHKDYPWYMNWCANDGVIEDLREKYATLTKLWPTFWFETNAVWGIVNNKEDWSKIKETWTTSTDSLDPDSIYNMRQATYEISNGVPSFGSRREHLNGTTTLGDFFDKHNLERT